MRRERSTWAWLVQEFADEAERASVRRWAAASKRWAALSVAIEDAARESDARARLEQALGRVP